MMCIWKESLLLEFENLHNNSWHQVMIDLLIIQWKEISFIFHISQVLELIDLNEKNKKKTNLYFS